MAKPTLDDLTNKIKRDGFFTLVLEADRHISNFARYYAIESRDDPIAILKVYKFLQRHLSDHVITSNDPYKLVWVDPQWIERESKKERPIIHGEVEKGDWDLSSDYFCERPVFQGLKSYIVDGVPLSDSMYYDWFIDEVLANGGQWGYVHKEDFIRRKQDIDSLIQSVSNNGFKSQRRLSLNDTDSVKSRNNDAIHHYLNEIHVDIGRDGEFLYRHIGQHRLAIAQILSIKKIPVLIATRHKRWETKNVEGKCHTYGRVHPDLL